MNNLWQDINQGIFVHNYISTDNFRLHSHNKLIHYIDISFKITLQHTDKFDFQCRFFLNTVQCFSGSDTKYCHGLKFGTKNLMCYSNRGFNRK